MSFLFGTMREIPQKVEKTFSKAFDPCVTKVRGKMHTKHVEEASVKAMDDNIDISSTGTTAPGVYKIELPKGYKRRFGSEKSLAKAVIGSLRKHADKKNYKIADDIEVTVTENEQLSNGMIVVKTEMKDVEDEPEVIEAEVSDEPVDEEMVPDEYVSEQPTEEESAFPIVTEIEEETSEDSDMAEYPPWSDEDTVSDEPTFEEPGLGKLTFTTGGQVDEVVEVAQWEAVIGRSGDIQVIDPRKKLISRKHALLRFNLDNQKYEIEDTSKHGTAVNGELLKNGSRLLENEDIIQLVRLSDDKYLVEMKFEYAEE